MTRKCHSTFTLFTLWIVLVIQHLMEQYFLLRNKKYIWNIHPLMDHDLFSQATCQLGLQRLPAYNRDQLTNTTGKHHRGGKELKASSKRVQNCWQTKRAKHKHEKHPMRVFSKNCGMIFHTICNAPVVPSEKQALTNILKVFCVNVSCKQLNFQHEQTNQNKKQGNWGFFQDKRCIAKWTVSSLLRLTALLNVLHVNVTRKNPWRNTGVTSCSAQLRKTYLNNLLESHVMS